MVTAANNALLAEDDIYLNIFDVHHMLLQAKGWSVHYNHHSTNRAAHSLAKLACNVTSDTIWIEKYTPSLDDVI